MTIDNSFILSFLEELIAINSVIGNEKELAVFLCDTLVELGMSVEFQTVSENRMNILASYQFSKKGKTLTFNSHLDTVDLCQGWTKDPFKASISDGKLFGLGSADMKSGIACQIAAIKHLLENSNELQGTIQFTGVVDEEAYGLGAKKLLDHPRFGRNKTDGIIIAEPIFGDSEENFLPLGATGKVLYEIDVQGKSAHAFTPEKGINAITDAAILVQALDTNTAIRSAKEPLFIPQEDTLFGKPSLCVLKMEGGYKQYSVVVPDSCKIILSRLTIPGETKKSLKKGILNFINSLDLPSSFEIQIVPPFYTAYTIEKNHELMKTLQNSYIDIFSREPFLDYSKMITDANTFMGEGNIPTVLFGPKGENLHAADEFVFIDTLVPCAKLYAKFFDYFQSI
jgi:succinyl-diaminopimelate desuccinylase